MSDDNNDFISVSLNWRLCRTKVCMMIKLLDVLSNTRNLALFLAASCVVILGFAYVSEYIFYYSPCPLCLWQRKPYFVVIVLAFLVLAFSGRNQRISFYLLLACGLGFLMGAGISGFHNGVEQGWWKGLDSCTGGLPSGVSLEELRTYLYNKKALDCRVPTWKLFGLSMAAYNFILSMGLTALTFFSP